MATRKKAVPTTPVADEGAQMRALLQAINGLGTKSAVMVGVRNICGSSVGLPAFANEPEILLHPFSVTDPNSVAIVSQARWQNLRKSTLFGQALIERFDEILDDNVPRAPEDRAAECHVDHEKNRLVDVVAFIEQSDESMLRQRISAMTSENQLHHIIGVVDRKQKELEDFFRSEDDPNPAKRAVDELPMRYQMADRFAEWRLSQIRPSKLAELPKPRPSF